MDVDISRWILDFIIRQPINDITIDKLLRVLPLPLKDPTFKKAILLRNISSEISKGVPSEAMLVLMEHIEEMDYQAGVSPSQALKTAYCDVAVDFTARLIQECQLSYSDSVNRVWGERVGLMIYSSGNIGLVSDELRNWKIDIEDSVVDGSDFVCEDDLLKKWRGTSYESLKSVRVYVDEARANMGISFLERVATNVGSEQIGKLLNPIEREKDQNQDERENNDTGKHRAEMMKRLKILHPRRKYSRGAKLSYDSSEDDSSEKKTGVESVVKDAPPPPPPPGVGPSMTTAGDYPEVIDLASSEENKKDRSKEKNDCGGRRVLPPSTVQNYTFCPLKRKDVKVQNGMRRKRKFWSNLEEETLLNAVRKFGTGNWKFILKEYKDIFDERTEGDLKDKWRNMIK